MKDEDKDFVFIVLELCECTLCELMEDEGQVKLHQDHSMLMKGMVHGMAYLHQVGEAILCGWCATVMLEDEIIRVFQCSEYFNALGNHRKA